MFRTAGTLPVWRADMASKIDPNVEQACEEFRRRFEAVRAEIAKAIVGHEEIVEGVLTCLFVGGHALLHERAKSGAVH